MSIYTFTARIESFEALSNALIDKSVLDAVIVTNDIYLLGVKTGDKNIKINTASSEADCATAISNALVGQLIANKDVATKSVDRKSVELIKQGLSHTSSGGTGIYPLDDVKGEFGYNESLVGAVTRNPSEMPQIIPTIDGAIPFVSLAEIENLADDVRHRYEYIYTNPTPNGDGSKSELLLKQEIAAATTQAELDLIIDTRS